MSARPISIKRCLAANLLLAANSWFPGAAAAEGFFAAVGIERSFSAADYEKSVTLASPFSSMIARDVANESADAFRAILGYRQPMSSRTYLAGEIEGAIYLNDETAGYLTGTGEGNVDVWPGPWTLERRHALGLNMRLGFVPDSLEFPGAERSLYLLAGIRWIDTRIEAEHHNRSLGIAGSRREDQTLKPGIVGIGVEFGGASGHYDLRFSYAAGDIAFGSSGREGRPSVDYLFDVRDWRVSFGYVVSLGD